MAPRYVRVPHKYMIGHGLSGEINTTYAKLCYVFGQPEGPPPNQKADAQWWLIFDPFTTPKVVNIYNFKDGKAYLGDEGTPTEDITEWHLGGHPDAESLVAVALENNEPWAYET